MNINLKVLALRNAIESIVGMLASRRVRVTQQGMNAYVEWDPVALAPRRVNIPRLPDDASDELVDAVNGFIDHEVGHLLHTDAKWSAAAMAEGDQVKFLQNAVEDPRIEIAQTRTFRGSAFNLANTARFVQREMIEPAFKAALAEGNAEKVVASLIVPMVRAIAGQQEWIDFMRDKWGHMKSVIGKMPQELVDRLREVSSSEDAFNAAKELRKYLGGEEPPESGEQSQPGEQQSGSSGQSEEPKEGEEPGSSSPQQGEEEPKEGEEPGQSGGAPEEGPENQESQAEAGEPQGEEGEQGPPSGPWEGNLYSQESSGINRQAMLEEMAKLSDYDGQLAEAVSARAFNEAKGSDYLVFTTDEDEISILKASEESFRAIPELEEAMDSMVGPLARELERLIVAKAASFWTPGHRSGRLHGASLARLRVGRDDVYRRKYDSSTKKVAWEFVVDGSGSMHSRSAGKIRTASFSAYALCSMLDRLQIPNEVISFTTKDHSPGVLTAMNSDPLAGNYARAEALRISILKCFDERVTPEVKSRFVEVVQNRNLCSSNVDGESLLIGFRRLLQRPEPRKIMVVLSDGRPAAQGGRGLDEHLRSTVETIARSGVEVFGIGICDQSVRSFYPRHVVINSVGELPGAMMSELRRFLATQ